MALVKCVAKITGGHLDRWCPGHQQPPFCGLEGTGRLLREWNGKDDNKDQENQLL